MYFMTISRIKLIFLYLNIRHCKYYTLNAMYIKLLLIFIDKKPNKIHENLILTKLRAIPYNTLLQHTTR